MLQRGAAAGAASSLLGWQGCCCNRCGGRAGLWQAGADGRCFWTAAVPAAAAARRTCACLILGGALEGDQEGSQRGQGGRHDGRDVQAALLLACGCIQHYDGVAAHQQQAGGVGGEDQAAGRRPAEGSAWQHGGIPALQAAGREPIARPEQQAHPTAPNWATSGAVRNWTSSGVLPALNAAHRGCQKRRSSSRRHMQALKAGHTHTRLAAAWTWLLVLL